MTGELLVEVENVSKKFSRDLKQSLLYGVRDLGNEVLGRAVRPTLRPSEFWALQDISFKLHRKDALGIIGPNGAGKSTLLKILSGLIKPTTGYVRMRGRVQALIELNAGFNPVLTGRENIYIRAAVLGMTRRAVDTLLDEIIGFSEVGDFIDSPVQNYSSGMKVRLGFAIAINIRPDVLIIDEVLSVGDASFRRKARQAMAELLDRDIALIFISHNIHEVLGITERTLWIEKGQPVMFDESAVVCAEYLYRSFTGGQQVSDQGFEYIRKRSQDVVVKSVNTTWNGQDCGRRVVVDADDPHITIDITLAAHHRIDELVFHQFELTSLDGLKVGQVVINDLLNVQPGEERQYRFQLDVSGLLPGSYQLAYHLPTDGGPQLEGVLNLVYIDVKARSWLFTESPHTAELNHGRMMTHGRGSMLLPITMHVAKPVEQ